jgi:hypothetical protein
MATFQTKLRCFPGPESILAEYDAAGCDAEPRGESVRGIGWVLKWAAAIAVLGATIIILLNFGYRLAAERTLARSAAAGIRAAALPRATSQTVEQSIRRELTGCFQLDRATQITIRCGGKPAKGIIATRSQARLTVIISAPMAAALPGWLGAITPLGDRLITIRSEKASGET